MRWGHCGMGASTPLSATAIPRSPTSSTWRSRRNSHPSQPRGSRMSILANKDTRVVIQGGAAGLNAARRMAEFCYMIKRPLNVEAFVYPPDTGKTNEVPYGSGLLTIPVYKSVADATAHHSQINTSLVYIGSDRACPAGIEALNDPKIQGV